MITKKTVLILGAGASAPYGFPTGQSLLQKICDIGHGSKLDHFTNDLRFDRRQSIEFFNALWMSGMMSVDAFLEHRPEFLKIGKGAIAFSLIPFEHSEQLFSMKTRGEDWYQHLFNKLSTRFEDLGKNNLSILTYNYDRSLEYYFLTAIKNSYGTTIDQAAENLKMIPIIHLHGQLGQLTGLSNEVEDIRDYEKTINYKSLKTAAEGIKIIHEGIEGNSEFSSAHRLISEAEIICFLGFGYDPTNLERLKINEFGGGKILLGTAYDLKPAECKLVQSRFNSQFLIDYTGNGALGFLQHSTPFDNVDRQFFPLL